jgi:cytoskeletal protein CcmA (bactofilin family)
MAAARLRQPEITMFNRKVREASSIGTLIGAGTTVTGDLGFTGGLHLDGRIVGDVAGEPGAALTVGPAGIIEGSVRVESLVLNGAVTGDVTAHERVELGPTAKVDGNVVYKTLQMAEGARVNGRLIHQAGGAAADVPAPGDDEAPGLR